MTRAPAVSIVIPVYNVARFLPRCLDSVLTQTFTDWEAICINDGSTDESGSILREYAARDGRIQVIEKENTGLSDTRNIGTSVARGEFILYLDSDDFIHPQTLEITHGLAVRNNADLVAFRHDARFHRIARNFMRMGFDVSKKLPASRNVRYNPMRIRFKVTNHISHYATERNKNIGVHRIRHCYPPMRLYRRRLVADVPFIPGIVMEDFPWWAEIMLRQPRTVIINTPLYFYMPNATSILNSSRASRMIHGLSIGLMHAYNLYSTRARPSQYNRFRREFLWPFIIIAMRKTVHLQKGELKDARRAFARMRDAGVFNNPPNLRAWRYARKIDRFIGNL